MRHRPGRRGLVMIGVLVIIALGALAGAVAMHASRNTALVTTAVQRGIGSRALALSGVQAVMAELAGGREALLLGGAPELTEAHTIFEDGSTRGIARIIAAPDGSLARAEASLVNPNEAAAEVLGLLPNIGPDLAQRIVSARSSRRFESVGDLLRVQGVTAQMIWGDPARMRSMVVVSGEASREPPAIDEQTPLADVLSVFTFEPDIQAGLGERGRDHAGERRINLNAEWSKELGDAITQRYDENTANGVKQVMESGQQFRKTSDIIGVLVSLNVPPEEWVEVLDAFTTDGGPFRVGLVDINSAPAAVLATLPGVTAEVADSIVQVRESLPEAERASIAWPVVRGIVAREEFGPLADTICARSLQYRVVIEAGIEVGGGGGARSGDIGGAGGVALAQRVVYEAVFDLAAPRPRVAYLRELTMLPAVAHVLAQRDPVDEPELDPFTSVGGAAGGAPATLDDLGDPATMDDAAEEADSGLESQDSDEPLDAGPDSDDHDAAAEPPSGPAPAQEIDNRIGRWTTG